MANNFNRASQQCNVTSTVFYTCPTSGVISSIVLLLQAANVTSRADMITILWTNASNGGLATRLTYQTPVPAQQAIGCLTGKLVLLPGDTLQAQCATFHAVELSMSVLETS